MIKRMFNISHISAGFTAVLVGYTSSVVIIIQAATLSGASPSQIASWLFALGIAMGLTSIGFSWYYKTPVLTAWSTPGAVVLIGSVSQYALPEIIGAFLFSGVLIVITGFVSPISKLLEKIPSSLATAMLGGILLPFCLKAFEPVTTSPILFCCMLGSFLVAKRFMPRYAMLILLGVGITFSAIGGAFTNQNIELAMSQPIWVSPEFNVMAIVNLGLPLYVVTMLSQNLPGVAMMRSFDYKTPIKPIFVGTGITNIIFAPFGGFSVNLAAISAAICMNDDVDSDKNQRYRAVIWAGVFYLLAGVWATAVVAVFLILPQDVTYMLAGLALLGTLLMCLQSAFEVERFREAALFTFLLTLSGISLLGVSSTLWGLLIGLIHIQVTTMKSKPQVKMQQQVKQ
ncbi:benzoate/H(+) symporter BenE family transporter [Vibrio sp. Of7-15]|uniref:benzoate/H(+) symporter BenE family transporter n=1 Tax=Vibrio sp. Of7-15 TaxID=2724879 RepID=UPI001EF18AEB|nr:benzoate/H(+) symporter BenE family transporter [Vibrio sp. Of7-15]MCG7495667.1 benzoate/H(+) symporter BenE family transporter [Vibrio sp. Of7-15]